MVFLVRRVRRRERRSRRPTPYGFDTPTLALPLHRGGGEGGATSVMQRERNGLGDWQPLVMQEEGRLRQSARWLLSRQRAVFVYIAQDAFPLPAGGRGRVRGRGVHGLPRQTSSSTWTAVTWPDAIRLRHPHPSPPPSSRGRGSSRALHAEGGRGLGDPCAGSAGRAPGFQAGAPGVCAIPAR